MSLLVFLAGSLTVLWSPLPAAAGPPQAAEVRLGFGGWVTPGRWMPLRVEFTAPSPLEGVLVVQVPIGPREGAVSYRRTVRLVGGRTRVSLDVIIYDPRRPILIRLVAAGRDVLRAEVLPGAFRAVDGVVVALTREPVGLEFLATTAGKVRPAYVGEDDLPARWQGYDGVRLLVIRDLQERRLHPAQQHALVDWVQQGGSLLVTGGEPLTLLRSRWLLDALPAQPTGATRTVGPGALEGLASPLVAAVLVPKRGAAIRTDRGLVLSATWTVGRGAVTVWAIDPFAPGVRAWPQRARLWGPLLQRRAPAPVASAAFADALPSASALPARAQVALLLLAVGYIAVVRAFLVRLAGRRAALAVMGGLAAGAAVLMYGFAAGIRGSTIAVSQLSIVEVLPQGERALATTYASVVSPYGGVFSLRGPAGTALRPLAPVPIIYQEDPAAIVGPAPARNLTVETAQVLPWPIRGVIRTGTADPEVVIENRSGLMVRDPVLYVDDRLYPLATVGPTLTARLDPARWEGIDRRPPPASDLGRLARRALFARLERMAAEGVLDPTRPWLVGTIADPRLLLRVDGAAPDPIAQMLVVPLQVR